ncbi:uncharacterized protein LOC125273084 [Megalobrama amblycephala]|uniref:uncharacterized protein LOC125273084 n=1 Tax=Megalobrama amblycephala TaxID=75352 RepID=UPI0020143ADF|nr:uncharacterized protein LOC125273084 [Megalobrama amblycephala]
MFHTLVLLCLCCLVGVFGSETNETQSVPVMEGDSVTLYIDAAEIQKGDNILWKYGAEKQIIAEISRNYGLFITYDGPDGRFRDRLKLDNQTGSLTITNITTEHDGVYQLEISGVELTTKTFSVSVYARLPVPVISSNSSQCSSSYDLPLLHIVLIFAAASGFLLILAAVIGIFCICRKQRKTVQRPKEDRTDSAMRKPKTRQKMPSGPRVSAWVMPTQKQCSMSPSALLNSGGP